MLISLYAMEKSESDDEDLSKDIESQMDDSQMRRNVNINILGFDGDAEEDKKKIQEIMDIVDGIINSKESIKEPNVNVNVVVRAKDTLSKRPT